MIASRVRNFSSGRRAHDYTRGSLLSGLVRLALPLVGGSVAMSIVFQVTDLAFVSRLGEAPMAAVIMVNQTLWQIVLMVTMGVNFATQAQIAHAIGGGRVEEAEH